MKAIVAGTGISGIGSAVLLLNHGYEVIVFDENVSADSREIRNKIISEIKIPAPILSIVLGQLTPELYDGAEICVMSPGISPGKAFARDLIKNGIKCISEIELAWRLGRGRVAAITGTNGKTTTTSLLGQIVRDAGLDGHTLGNIGRAYTGEADELTDESISVVEVAGFHLETIDKFRPDVSAILNITPDHLDRFGTMEAYIAAKERIAENQTEKDVCVLNFEDEELRKYASSIRAKVLFFSSERELEEGAFLRNDRIMVRLGGQERPVCQVQELRILGKHNYENVMAALLMALSLGIDSDSIRESLLNFKGVEHRIEYVTSRDGIIYYNDSKGTNPDASIKAVQAMNRPVVLIAGGYDKHVSFDEWVQVCRGRVRHMVILGECGGQIAETCDRYGFKDYEMAVGFDEAVHLAMKAARAGDAVLLSPGCASWDMFKSFEIRGKRFKELVAEGVNSQG